MNLQLYESSSKNAFTTVTNTCLQTGPMVQTLAQRIANVEGTPLPSDMKFTLVRLAADRCPDWVSGGCTLSVATKSDIVVGISFLTVSGAESDIEASISEKYDHAPTSKKRATCQNNASAKYGLITREGTDRFWQLPRLSIAYWPVNGLTCEQGRVLVESETLTKLIDRSVKQKRERQPKM